MALRDKMRANAQPLLEPGEEIQAVFQAQTKSAYMALLSYWFILFTKYRVVVVTDRRILVCAAGKLRPTQVKEIIVQLPRNTLIGPAHGLWYKTESLGPQALHINKRFHKDVAAADAVVDPTAG